MEDKEIFENWELFKTILRKTNRDGVENMIKWLDESDFKFAPASTQYHNSFRGGLLRHSLDVYYHMYDFKNFIDFFEIPEDTIIITSLLHDICKVNTYVVQMRNKKDAHGQWIQVPYYEWDDLEPIGHGEKSVMLMYELDLKPTKIERAMIRNHMGYSLGDDNKRDVSHLFAKCPQTLILHWADELATFVYEGTNLQDKFRQKLVGRNLSESLIIKEKMDKENSIQVNGILYKIAPDDSVVDNVTIGEFDLGDRQVKIYLKTDN